MIISNIAEAEAALQPYVPLVKQLTGKDTTLERIRPLMSMLGNPEQKLKIIHIAGTSGKTSTAYYVAALLQAVGRHVGLTVSPHVDSVRERVQLDGQPIGEAEFCKLLGEFLDIVEQAEQKPSYFELLYAFSIWVFNEKAVDYAVIETGVGGLYDATNVAERQDKVCVITDIGFDHTHLLGGTLDKIAKQKIGIVHDQNEVLMYQQPEAAMTVINDWISSCRAKLHIVEEDQAAAANQAMPDYQFRNWTLAHSVYRLVANRDNLQSLTSQELARTQTVQVPARMEMIKHNNKIIVMDGAHNTQKMTAFLASFSKLYPTAKPAILLTLKDNKEIDELAKLIKPLAARVIVTSFRTQQDLPVASMDPNQLSARLTSGGVENVVCLPNQHEAFDSLIKSPEEVCIITGSFYLLSQLRNKEHLG